MEAEGQRGIARVGTKSSKSKGKKAYSNRRDRKELVRRHLNEKCGVRK